MEYILVASSLLSAIATTVGVVLVLLQLKQNGETETTKFENEVIRRFIEISNEITFHVMYLNPQTENFKVLIEEKLQGFYKYFDLTNQEFFLMEDERISDKAAEEWTCGVIELMKLPSFQYAWERISSIIPENTFTQLRGKIINWKKAGHI